MKDVFNQGDILLDCLPGTQAPKMARFAKDFNMHYANLTEYVAETEELNHYGLEVHRFGLVT